MNETIVWSSYLLLVLLSVVALRGLRLDRLGYMDGLLVGSVYYVTIPMLLVLIEGRISGQFILVPPYDPYADIDTTFVLLGGCAAICLLSVVSRPSKAVTRTNAALHHRVLWGVVLLFAATTVATFFMSGLNEGGHWAHTVGEAIESSPTMLVVKYVANFARTVAFGLLLFYTCEGKLRIRWGIGIGVLIAMTDILLTFNRITAVYLVIAIAFILIVYRRYWSLAGFAAVFVTIVPFAGNAWPIFRGIATENGYNLEGMWRAATVAISFTLRSPNSFAEYMNGIYETINIPVLNYVVKNVGTTFDPLMGSTFLVRPFTVLLPSFVWPDRPPVFGSFLGQTIQHVDGLALNSTAFGEAYGNFGAFWPIFYFPVALLYDRLFRIASRQDGAFGAMAMFVGIGMWRFDSSFAVICLILTLVTFSLSRAVGGIRTTHTLAPLPSPPGGSARR